jgi:hypothetical protein
MMGGSIGHCTTALEFSSMDAAESAFIRVVSTRDCVSSQGGIWTGGGAATRDCASTGFGMWTDGCAAANDCASTGVGMWTGSCAPTNGCVSISAGIWTGSCAAPNDCAPTSGCADIGVGARVCTAPASFCEGMLAPGTAACSPSLANNEATPDCPASTGGSVLTGAVVTMAFSAPLLRARLTPAMSVQRAAFSAMLRSVSWTLAGGATFCAVAMGRV